MTRDADVRVLRSLEEIEPLQADWKRLASQPDHDWDIYWSELQNAAPTAQPYMVALTDGSQLLSALVGRLEAGRVSFGIGYWKPVRLPARRIVIPMHGVLGASSDATLAALVERVVQDVRDGQADVAVFEFLEEGSALHTIAKGLRVGFWMRDRVPMRRIHRYVNLPATFKEYDRQHKGLLQKVRKFERTFQGRFEHRVLTQESEIEAFCEGADAVVRLGYQRALGVGFLNSDGDRSKLRAAARAGTWRAFVTLVDGKTVAFWSGCQFGNSALLWWTGYDSSYQEFSPGLVSSARMVERLIESGVTRLDFGGGDAAYKERLADEAKWEETVCVYAPSFKGALANSIRASDAFVGNLSRTHLKGLANRLKTPWRRFMARKQASGQSGLPASGSPQPRAEGGPR